jgi:hypothetical protein
MAATVVDVMCKCSMGHRPRIKGSRVRVLLILYHFISTVFTSAARLASQKPSGVWMPVIHAPKRHLEIFRKE